MASLSSIRILWVGFLIILNACNDQPTRDKVSDPGEGSSLSLTDSIVNSTAGIVYFSTDNGLSWQDKSNGLPPTASIGLGGIATAKNQLVLLAKNSGLYTYNTQQDYWRETLLDQQLWESNPGALIIYRNAIFMGTQTRGVFYSEDAGKSWNQKNAGLQDLSIRRFAEIEGRLYVATNAGLYQYDNLLHQWALEKGTETFQVNGITDIAGKLYIATNQGAFTAPRGQSHWTKIFADVALHNISSVDHTLYAMVYNELYVSTDRGITWKNIQEGLPAQLYTFNVVKAGHSLFAAQWDGIYRKESEFGSWTPSSRGLPEQLAFTNMQVYQGIIVVSGNPRQLKAGMNTDK